MFVLGSLYAILLPFIGADCKLYVLLICSSPSLSIKSNNKDSLLVILVSLSIKAAVLADLPIFTRKSFIISIFLLNF